MVYTQMLFALLFDKIVWNSTPGLWGLLGSVMILGSALFVAVSNGEMQMIEVRDGSDEEAALMEWGNGHGSVESLSLEMSVVQGKGTAERVDEVELGTVRV